MANLWKWIKRNLLTILIVAGIGVVVILFSSWLNSWYPNLFGCQEPIPGRIEQVDDQLVIATPDRGIIKERDLAKQEALEYLGRLEWALEYIIDLETQISEGGGEIIYGEDDNFVVHFRGETDAGQYEGEVGSVSGEIYHVLKQDFNPIPLQVYIDRNDMVSVSSTATWVKIIVDEVRKADDPWWTGLWLGGGVGGGSFGGEPSVIGSLGAGYGGWGGEIGWSPKGWTMMAKYRYSFE